MGILQTKKQRIMFFSIIAVVLIVVIAVILVTSTENTKKDAHISNALRIISSAKTAEANGWDLEGEGLDAYEDLSIGDMTDPWEGKKYKVARVYKNPGGYGVELKAESGKCDIDDMENLILTYDTRICDD